jgi:hypothetical protein
MTDVPAVRVSDADRERAAAELREHCTAGRLTLEELSERLEEAYTAQTSADLERVRRELPEQAPTPRRRPKRLTLAAFGSFVRRGRWRVGRRTLAISVFGDVDLDLREAEVQRSVVTVSVLALFGNVDVYVPDAAEVDAGGVVIFGHRREWGRDEPRPGAPLVRVRVLALFGTVDVWRVPPGTTGHYREIIRALRAAS